MTRSEILLEAARRPALQFWERMSQWLTWQANAVLIVGAWLVVGVAALVIADVLGRTLFAHPITGTVELARNTVVLIVFCQVPISILEGKMLRVVAIFSRLSPVAQRTVESIAAVVAMVIFCALVASGVAPMIRAFQTSEVDGIGELQMPMGPVRAILSYLWLLSVASALRVLLRSAQGEPPVIDHAGH